MRKVTRVIEDDNWGQTDAGYPVDIKIEINDSDQTIVFFVDEEVLFKSSREDFLDFIVACWPENVAYQFSEDDDV